MTKKNRWTDEEISAMPCVPLHIAAEYIGMPAQTIRLGLRYGHIPFGIAVKLDPSSKRHVYNIPGPRLVAYKNGTDMKVTQEGGGAV